MRRTQSEATRIQIVLVNKDLHILGWKEALSVYYVVLGVFTCRMLEEERLN